jgi:hypothetical protein
MSAALTGGRWVLRGGIRRFVPAPDRFIPAEPDPVDLRLVSAKPRPAQTPWNKGIRVTERVHPLCDCGCVLTSLVENCPNCRVWARKVEAEFNRTAVAA